MLESEKEADMEFGYLVVFRKGQTSSPYELDEGDHSIGSSRDCNIRLKFSHPLLMQIHAIIRVNEDGVATILNKSVGAPVKVNEKIALKPTILKHEDKFEILDKVFQYFNDHLKHEPADSQKFVKGKIGILNKGRQSVHPLTTPAKKSPNLKTKILSVRKSTSAVPRHTKGLQVTITPSNKKPDSHIGSKTTSKIVVSKALASPCTAKKRRLSLDNPGKVSQTPKISSRNILLSKSTINITISEEHEYSEIVPSTSNKTVQEEDEKLKARTPRRSVKVENTPNNDVSVALIDFNSPTPVKKSAVRQSTLESLNEEPAENQNTINVMKTPVNKRIRSLKTVRHSLKKDTPPPRLALPKVIIHPPTPQGQVKGSPLNKSGLDNSVKSLVKSSERSLDTSRNASWSAKSNMSFHTENTVDPDNSQSSRISRSLSRRNSKVEMPINSRADDDTIDEKDNTIKSSKISTYSSRRSRKIETPTGYSQTDDNTTDAKDNVNRSSRISRTLKVDAPVSYQTEDNTTYENDNVKSYRVSRYTPRQSTDIKVSADTSQTEDNTTDEVNKSSRASRSTSRRSTKIKVSANTSQTDDNTTDVEDSINMSSRFSRSLRVDAPFNSQTETDSTDEDNVNKFSRASRNTSRRSTKNKVVSIGSSQTDDIPTDIEDNINMSSRLSRSLRVDGPFNSQSEDNTTDEGNVNKSSIVSRNTSRRSTMNKVSGDTSQTEDNIDTDDHINKSSRASVNASRRITKKLSTGPSQTDDIPTDVEGNSNLSSRFSRSLRVDAPFNSQTETDSTDEDNVNKFSRASRNTSRRSTKNKVVSIGSSQTDEIPTYVEDNINMSSKLSRSLKVDAPFNTQSEDNTTDEGNISQSARVSRNTSRRNTKSNVSAAAETSQIKDNIDTDDNTNKYSRRSRTIKEPTGSSQTDDNTTDMRDSINMSSRFSRSLRVDAPFNSQTETDTTDEDNVKKSFRVSKNTSKQNTKVNVSTDTSQTEDNTDTNINKSSKLSINASRRSRNIEETTGFSQTDDNTTDAEDSINMSSRFSRRLRVDAPFNSQTETDTTDEDNVNKFSRASSDRSRRSTKMKSANTSQIEDKIDARDSINKTSKVSINTSRRTVKIEATTGSSQTDDNATDAEDSINMSSRFSRSLRVDAPFNSQTETDTTDDDNLNKFSRASRNTSRRSTKIKSANTSQTENKIDARDNVNKSSKVSINTSRRSIKIEATTGSSQTDDNATDAEDRINMSSRSSKNIRVDAPVNSQTETDTADEDRVNKSSRISRNTSRRSTKNKVSAGPFQTEDNIDAEHINKSSRVSRNASKRSGKMDASTDSSQTDYNTTDARDNRRSNNISSLLTEDDSTDEEESLDKSASAVQEVSTYSSDQSSRNWSRRTTRVCKSHSSIDSTETTMDMQQKSRNEADITNSNKNKSRLGLSLYDETTQEVKLNTSAPKNRSVQRVGIFEESTREAFPQFNKANSMKPISILDDTQEVLSPVRPFSPSKSIRNIQNEDLQGSVRSSTRVSSIRRSRTKSRTLQDSSLTSTSMDQSSSSVISVSSQSFSSFKKGSSGKDKTRDETEIDVVNVSSASADDTEVKKKSFKDSGRFIQNEVLDKSNASRSSRRQPRTSEMFKDVSCTSTPFHKNNSSKERSRESETSEAKNVTKHESPRLLISVSSDSDLGFAPPPGQKGTRSSSKRSRSNSNIFEETETVRRSNRSSVSKLGGEHDCVSCRYSSIKRSRSLSLSSAGESSNASRPSNPARKPSGILHKPIYEDHSPVKRISSAASSKVTTPLLHRISHVTSLSEKTPEKFVETEDETPKSSIKPARRSSKSNQSAYNPTVEDITPVTPEKLTTSGFAEDVFKTPINTPGLFENIRKSVIRSRKRHRESTGSVMKDAKRARVDFAQEEQQLETSTNAQQESRQTSPLNRLSNFEGVKKLMRTPLKSPKNDLRNVPNLRNLVSPKKQGTPKNDLTNVDGVKKMFSTPKDVKSPRNDLTKIPNLRRLVSPKRQNTPKNDLTQVPNLKRIMSPKHQKSPKNDLSSPVGVKRLLKTPTVQKKPIDDLGNVTGVANMFNVSGVEVLHQGSDIENSEDLFTQLTGKRPVRAYPRGKSMSPNKDEAQDQPHTRKTMGDIPICSPRVQQWVEDHANVNYVTTETPGLPLSADEDVFFNVSEKATRKSKSGRSVSPKKLTHAMTNRRKTHGDALGDDPNITAWKEEQILQAKTRKLSTDRNINVKTEFISSQQTLQNTMTMAEKVTPQQSKFKQEIVTPKEKQMTPVGESATPASVRARRGRKKVVEDQHEAKVDEKKTGTLIMRDKTPIITEDDPEQIQKEIENKPLAAIKRGRRAKRLMSDQDVLTSTTASPIQEPVAKKHRTRLGDPKIDSVDPEVGKIMPKTRPKRGKIDSQKSCESESVDEAELKKPAGGRLQKKTDALQATPEVSASPVRRGGRRGKLLEEDKAENEVFSDTVVSASDKPTSRSRSGRKIDELVLEEPDIKAGIKEPAYKGRKGKKEELQADDHKVTPNIKLEVKEPSRGRKAKNMEDEKSTQNADVVGIIEKPLGKKATRNRKAKKSEDEEIEESVNSKGTQNEKVEIFKRPPRGRRAKKAEDEAAQIEEPVVKTDMDIQSGEVEVVKRPPRGRRANKAEDEAAQIEEPVVKTDMDIQSGEVEVVKRPPRGRRAKKAEDEAVQIEEPVVKTDVDAQSGEVEVVKPVRGRKAKKMIKEEVPENTDVDDQIEEPVLAKTMRSKRGRKGEDKQAAKEKDSQAKVKEVFKSEPKGRGIKKLIQEEAAEEISDPEVEFQYTARNTRSRSNKDKTQASSAIMAETVASPAKGRKRAVQIKDESVPNAPTAKAVRGRRGANVVEEVQSDVVEEKKVTEKGASKRKVRFEDEGDQGAEKGTPNARKSKRTRK